VAYAALAALPAEGPPLGDAGLALIAVLRDLLQLPASKGNGGASGESAAAVPQRPWRASPWPTTGCTARPTCTPRSCYARCGRS
jgi:hypothetical protein